MNIFDDVFIAIFIIQYFKCVKYDILLNEITHAFISLFNNLGINYFEFFFLREST